MPLSWIRLSPALPQQGTDRDSTPRDTPGPWRLRGLMKGDGSTDRKCDLGKAIEYSLGRCVSHLSLVASSTGEFAKGGNEMATPLRKIDGASRGRSIHTTSLGKRARGKPTRLSSWLLSFHELRKGI